ncbi:MAG: DUF748 domain-containing protein [Candidatus Omnitrophota bacterium]|nr:DUF748 domain-containing protein [Candidatus Omnitrophota bacterium]
MRKINKILLWIIAVFFTLFIIANIAVSLFAKQIIVRQIEENLKVPVTLGSINVGLPLSIKLSKLSVGDLFKADEVSVSPNILGFFAGKLVLSSVDLVNPLVNLERSADGRLNLPKLDNNKGKPPAIYLTSLSVRNGKLIFIDRKIDPSGYKIILANLNSHISKVMLPPASLKVNFKLSADLLAPDSRKLGSTALSGWLDFGPKDMDGNLIIKDLDLTYFSPYYGNFISDKKLLSAKLNINTNLKAENNNLKILTDFRLSNLTYSQEAPVEGTLPEINFAKNALEFFTDSKGNLNLEFEINTRLDHPNVTVEQLKKVILKAASKNLSNQSPEELMKKVNANIDQFKAIGKTLKNIFKGKE